MIPFHSALTVAFPALIRKNLTLVRAIVAHVTFFTVLAISVE